MKAEHTDLTHVLASSNMELYMYKEIGGFQGLANHTCENVQRENESIIQDTIFKYFNMILKGFCHYQLVRSIIQREK